MHNEYDNSSPHQATQEGGDVPADDIPVLHEVVKLSEYSDIPTLEASYAVTLDSEPLLDNALSAEHIAEIVENLQLTLERELDYAIDGAVYDVLQAAMEKVAAGVKKQIHDQLEQKLPNLIEQRLGKVN